MTKTPAVYFDYSRYYDLLYRDKDYVSEAAYIQALLSRYGVHRGDLLEFGSGTGKHGRLLGELGYRVHGIERSATMVAQAKGTDGFTSQQGDICTVQMGRTYDAVFSLFHVVSYQTGNSDLRAVFTRASEHLQSGGLFAFDVWYSPAVYAQRPAVRVKRVADEQVEIIRIAEPEVLTSENRVDVNYTIIAKDRVSGDVQILTEKHPMRHLSLPEIDLLAESTNFRRIGAAEFLTDDPPSEDTWGICVILQRI